MKLFYIVIFASLATSLYASDAKTGAEHKYHMEAQPSYKDFMAECESEFDRVWNADNVALWQSSTPGNQKIQFRAEKPSYEHFKLYTMKDAYTKRFKTVFPYASLAEAQSPVPLEIKATSELATYLEKLKSQWKSSQLSCGQRNKTSTFESALVLLEADKSALEKLLKSEQVKGSEEALLRERKLAADNLQRIDSALAALRTKK